MPTVLCILLLLLLDALPASAAEVFGTPIRVMLGPKDARITAEQEIPIATGQDGRAEVRFLLPVGAGDLSITAQDRTVEDWSSATTYLSNPGQAQHERRTTLMNKLTVVEGEIQATQARLALWNTGNAKELSFDDLDKRDGKMQQIIPQLHSKLHEFKEQAKALKAELSSLPSVGKEAVLTAASLSGPAKGTAKLLYTYSTEQCGWRPLYRFTAFPDRDVVLAQLSAEIRQNSGQEWNNAELTLVSHNVRQQAPNKLSPWRVENTDTDRPPAPAQMGRQLDGLPAAGAGVQPKVTQEPVIQMMDRDAFVTWELGKRALREGTSRLTIHAAEWKAPIFWLARPSQNKHTFIAARCTVDDPRAWPGGPASYFLNGAAVGSGAFALKSNKVDLFFGSDPRVTVEREKDARQSGRSGIIGKRQTWEWNWTFKAFNGRSKPVLLRVEDAQPQARDKDIAITMHSKPEHKSDDDHTLYWELTIPANQGMEIIHSVTVSAPADMRVRPGR